MYVTDDCPAPIRETRPTVRSPSDIFKLAQPMIRYRQEVFRVFLLNTKNVVVRKVTISKGSLNASIVHPREILRPAILASAASIVLVHNHPSGDPTPSREDIEFTRRIVKCGELIGIQILDHVIVGKGGYASLKERGLF